MKKLLFTTSFLLCSVSSFAYYGEYESSEPSGFMYFLCALIVIWSILNIILFFKLWGATDNIDKISHYLLDKPKDMNLYEFEQKIFLLNAKGKKEELYQLLNDKLESDISYYVYRTNDTYYSAEKLNLVIKNKIEKFLPYYQVFDLELPSYFSNLTNDNYHKYITRLEELSK